MLKYFDIKPVVTKIINPQDNAPLKRVHQVILNMIVNKYLTNKVFDYIDTWGETLAYIAWAIRASYHHTIKATPDQPVFGRDMISNVTSVVDWRVITAGKQQQVNINNVQENARQVTHDYTIINLVYVETTGT